MHRLSPTTTLLGLADYDDYAFDSPFLAGTIHGISVALRRAPAVGDWNYRTWIWRNYDERWCNSSSATHVVLSSEKARRNACVTVRCGIATPGCYPLTTGQPESFISLRPITGAENYLDNITLLEYYNIKPITTSNTGTQVLGSKN